MVRIIDISERVGLRAILLELCGRRQKFEAYGLSESEIESAVQAFAASLGPKPSGERLEGWSTARAPNLGRLLSIAGGTLEIGGGLILLLLFARLANETAESLFLFSYLVMGAGMIVLPPVGAIVRRFGKQLQQPTASERLLNCFAPSATTISESSRRKPATRPRRKT